MNERLKELREKLNLNQREFSSRVDLSQPALAMIEKGSRVLRDIHISRIVSEFNVNEVWLKTGEGEIFVENDSSILAELATEYRLDDIDKKIIEHYLNLDSEVRQILKKEVVALAKKFINVEEVASAVEFEKEEDDIDIDAELASYRKELEDAKKIRTSSALRTHDETS